MNGKRPPLDEQKSLWESTVAREGVTTVAGNIGGTSFTDAGLVGAGVGSFVSMMAVIYPGQPRLVDSRDITGFDNATGETAVATAFKGGQVPIGVPYKIVTFRFVPAEVAALAAALATHDVDIKALLATISTTAMGRAQIAATTIDLFQAANTYDLLLGTAQAVILESLNIKLPTGAIGGTITGITIQTDDATPGVIINAAAGAVANLLTEADLGWTGTLYITVGTKIRLTIVGGPAGAGYICNVTAKCRAVVSGGYLA